MNRLWKFFASICSESYDEFWLVCFHLSGAHVASVLLCSLIKFFFFILTSTLSSLTHDYPQCLPLHGSLKVCWVCFHTRESGLGRTEIMCVRVCVCTWGCLRSLCLSVEEKENSGRGKSLPDLLTEQYFQKYTNVRKTTTEKSTAEASLSLLLLLLFRKTPPVSSSLWIRWLGRRQKARWSLNDQD